MTTSKARARAQQGPRRVKRAAKKTTPKTMATARGAVRDAFHQSTSRDFVKKMTVEIDQDLHAELKMIAARQGVTIRAIVASQLERYVHENR